MNNIKILNNFPKELMDEFKNYYELKYKGKDPEKVWSDKHSASLMSNRDINYFNKFLPESTDTMDLYFVFKGRMMPHIDRGRKTAFQIPIDIDLENSYTYSLKNRDLSILTPSSITFSRKNNESINRPEHWFYEWKEDAFDQYNLEKPILQNAAMPHGGANFGPTCRIFFSGSYTNDFDDMVEKFKNWL
jgi:hypothetical protein